MGHDLEDAASRWRRGRALSTEASDSDRAVEEKSPRGEIPIAEYTPLYERYAEAATLARLYAPPERFDEARRVLGI